MLTNIDPSTRRYTVVLNNYTDAAEILSDLSYLDGQLPGELCFDFRHMAAAVTQETREEYLPGNFGYQPTRQLAEVAATLIDLAGRAQPYAHRLAALLPRGDTRVGSYLTGMRLDSLLCG